MRLVSFEVFWTIKGEAEIEVSDDFDLGDIEGFKKYVDANWDKVIEPSYTAIIDGSRRYADTYPVCIFACDEDEDSK